MTIMAKDENRFVVCIEDAGHPASLEARKIYEVIPDPEAERQHHLRVIDDSGEDYLYPEACFMPVELPLRVREALRGGS